MKSSFYLYEKIYYDLLENIQNGQWAPGYKLPTEHELAATYEVSRITSKRALNMLAEEGFVVRRPGIGTVVSTNQLAPPQAAGANQLFSLQKAPLKPLGLIMEDLGESYSLLLYYALEKKARELGFQICLAVSYGDQKKEREALHQLMALGVIGMIVMPAHGRFYNTDLLRLVLSHFPVVLLDRPLVGIPAPSVHPDNLKGSRMLTEHLIAVGHRNIAFLTSYMEEALSLEDRHQGYIKAMEKNNLLPLNPVIISSLMRVAIADDQRPALALKGEEEIYQFLQNHPSVTAVICAEYGIARFAQRAAAKIARQGSYEATQPFSIVSFDDKYGYLGEYRFTHIKQDEERLAEESLTIISAMLDGKNMRRQNHIIPVSLRLKKEEA